MSEEVQDQNKIQEAQKVLQEAMAEEQKAVMKELQDVLDKHPKFAMQVTQQIVVVPR